MGEERWMLHTKRADFERIGKQFSVSPVVARIIRNRDVESDEDIRKYLFGGLSDLYSPHRMKDMDRAVQIILGAIREGGSFASWATMTSTGSAPPTYC